MDRLKRAALLTSLIRKMRDHGSWCGETHIQKAAYFLEDLFMVPMDFGFILYRHGPFSFDLRDELTSMRADDLLEIEPQAPPYGPRIAPTERSEHFKRLFPKTLRKYNNYLEFVADKIGDKGVTELEQLATALYVTKRKKPEASVTERAEELSRLKPHISFEAAQKAIEDVDHMIEEAKKLASCKINPPSELAYFS